MVGYFVAGFTAGNLVATLAVAIGLLVVCLVVFPKVWGMKKARAQMPEEN